MGVGGIDSWSRNAWPLPAYRLDGSQPMSFRLYRLSPIDGDFTPRTREAFWPPGREPAFDASEGAIIT